MPEERSGVVQRLGSVVGPGASAIKYDLVTALLVLAAQGPPVEARLALRLSLMITARYNWRAGTFSVGLKEMARLWGVTDRTAKREVAAMRTRAWLRVARPAARGRVASYAIQFDVVLRETMPFWDSVGPDYTARMIGAREPDPPSNVVPLRQKIPDLPDGDAFGWSEAAQVLRDQDLPTYSAWFAHLRAVEFESGTLTLMAPSRFVADYVRTHFHTRLMAAIAQVQRGVRDIQIIDG